MLIKKRANNQWIGLSDNKFGQVFYNATYIQNIVLGGYKKHAK